MKKRILSIALAFSMLLALMPTLSIAETYGDLTYSVYDGEITVTGCSSGTTALVIPDTIDGLPVTAIESIAFHNMSNLETVVLPDSVTSIGSSAFYGCTALASLTLGSGLKTIDYEAFSKCSKLTAVTIPEGVTTIGDSVFYGCSSLTGIVIPESVTSIGRDTFYGCTSLESAEVYGAVNIDMDMFYNCPLKSVTIGKNVKSIEMDAFHNMSSLETVVISEGLTSIGENAFRSCTSLTSIELPDSITSIGREAFYGCTALASLTLGSGLKTIDYEAFSKCTKLTAVTIPEGVTSIGDSAFYGCSSLTGIVIPESVTSIGDSAFYGCSSLTGIVIPEGVTSIGEYAFYNCTSLESAEVYGAVTINDMFYNCPLKSVKLGKNVKSIGSSAFYRMSSLETVVISEGLTTIGSGAFSDCSKLTSVNIPGTVENIGASAFNSCSALAEITLGEGIKTIGSSAFSGCIPTTLTIPDSVTSIGSSALNFYTSTGSGEIPATPEPAAGEEQPTTYSGPATLETLVIGSGVTSLKDVFGSYGNDALQSVTIGSGVEDISGAFDGSEFLTEVIFESGSKLKSIGERAFDGCKRLAGITIPAGVTSIGKYAFCDCSALTNIDIPAGVTSIGNYAFEYCSALIDMVIPESVASIGSYAFAYCSKLANINIPAGITSIADGLFCGCSKLSGIVIPADVTSIGYSAFSGCSSLTDIDIPAGVTSIGSDAFYGCSKLTSIVIPEGVTAIEREVFYDCSKLESVNIPAGVTSIGSYAFYGCLKLANINIPEGVKSIGEMAFYGCDAIVSAVIPAGVTSIGYGSFSGCDALTSIDISEGVTSIGSRAFNSCPALAEVILPSSLTLVGYNAFNGCSNIETVIYDGTSEEVEAICEAGNEPLLNATLLDAGTEFTLTYDPVYGTGAPSAQTAVLKSNYTVSDVVPTREGYMFHGWTDVKDSTEAKYQAGDTILVKRDVTLYAVWDADLTLSIPSETLTPKIYDIIEVPVSVTDNRGFASLTFSVSYNADAVSLTDVAKTEKTALATVSNSGGNILITSPTDITGDGEILTLKFSVSVNALNTESDITIVPVKATKAEAADMTALIQTGNVSEPVVLSASGDATGNNEVDGGDTVAIARYLAKYVSHGLVSEADADVYTDEKINLKDLYVLSQWIVNNVTSAPQSAGEVRPLSAVEIRMLSTSVYPFGTNPQISSSVSKVSENGKNYADVTISIGNNYGFTGFDFGIDFDNTKLTPVSITEGEKVSGITSNVNDAAVDWTSVNRVTTVWSGTSEVTEDCTLYTVRFEIKDTLSDTDYVTFVKNEFTKVVSDIPADYPTKIPLDGSEPDISQDPTSTNEPSEPGTTTEPSVTTEPSEPDTTTEPSGTTEPSEPDTTTEPSVTTEPSEPDTTTEPSEPETSAEPKSTDAPSDNLTPVDKYEGKVTVEKKVADGKIELTVTSLDDSIVDELANINLFSAEYNEQGQLTSVHFGVKSEVVNGAVTITADMPTAANYKLMLWDKKQSPLIAAITGF